MTRRASKHHVTSCLTLMGFLILAGDVCRGATYKSQDDGHWSKPGTWKGGKCPGTLDDIVVIRHRVVLDRDVAIGACMIGQTKEEKKQEEEGEAGNEEPELEFSEGAVLVLKPGKTLTIRDEIHVAATGLFTNQGGVVNCGAPHPQRFTLKVSGRISASGTTRIVNADIIWDSDQRLSSLYSNTPEEDQLRNAWVFPSSHTLMLDMNAALICVVLRGRVKASFKVEAPMEKSLRILKFADVPHGGILNKQFDLDQVSLSGGAKLLSLNHNGTGEWRLLGPSRESALKLSDIGVPLRFAATDNVVLKNVTLVLDHNAECRDLTVGPDAMLQLQGHKLTVHGKERGVQGPARKADAPAKKDVVPGAGVDGEGFIRRWLVLLPIRLSGHFYADCRKDYLSGEANVAPVAGQKVKVGAKEYEWRLHESKASALDFDSIVGANFSVGYAVCYVDSPEDMPNIKVAVGCDDLCKVYINGRTVIETIDSHSLSVDRYESAMGLKKGRNVVVFKVADSIGGWSGCLRFKDAQGKPITGLNVSTGK